MILKILELNYDLQKKAVLSNTLEVVLYIGYFVENRKKHVGNLEIDADGIRDLSDSGMVVGFSWNNIKGIVIKKHTINIITDNSIYFFIDITYKERLLIAIERYNKDLPIIDKTK